MDRRRQRDGLGDLARPDEAWCTVNIGESSCVRRALGSSVADSARKAESPAWATQMLFAHWLSQGHRVKAVLGPCFVPGNCGLGRRTLRGWELIPRCPGQVRQWWPHWKVNTTGVEGQGSSPLSKVENVPCVSSG